MAPVRFTLLATLVALALPPACGPVAIHEALSSSSSSSAPDHTTPETFLAGPTGYSNEDSVVFTFSSNEGKAKFEARLDCENCADDEGWFPVKSPYTTTGVLAEGPHLFEVRAFDSAGHVDGSAATNPWITDRTPPESPAWLTVDPETTTSLKLAWASGVDALSGVASYRVFYENVDAGAPVETANEGSSGFSVGLLNGLFLTGLQPCNHLQLWITAVDHAGNEGNPALIVAPTTWCGWDETFSDVGMIPVGTTPESLVAGDFNGDGHVDLAIRTTEDIRLLDGDGQQSFVASLPPFAAGSHPTAIAAGDFNGDLSTDLVAVNAPASGSPQITVFEGLCGGGLSPIGILSTGPAPICVAAAGWDSSLGSIDSGLPDISGDDITDLFVGGTFGARYYLGCKGMDSSPPVPRCDPAEFLEICTWGLGGAVVACNTGDFDGDGRQEVVVVTDAGTIAVLLTEDTGGGQSSYFCGGMDQTPPKFSNAGPGSSAVAVADFDSDGKLDLAVANATSPRVSVLLGNGPDTFSSPIEYDVGENSHAIATADFDGNGITDLAVATDDGFSVLLGNGIEGIGDGTFSSPIFGPHSVGTAASDIVARDFDGDHIIDLALCLPQLGAIYVLRGGGATHAATGFFSSPQLPLPLTQAAVDVFTADFNADGIDDLAMGSADEVTTIYMGNGSEHHGNGTFHYGASYLYAQGVASTNELQRQLGDFNGDGLSDLVVCSCGDHDDGPYPPCGDNGDLRVRLATGDPAGALGNEVSGSTNTIKSPIAADFDRDGFQDLAGAYLDEGIVILRGNPDGELSPGSSGKFMQVLPDVTNKVIALTPADLDGDGRLDLAMVTQNKELEVALQHPGTGSELPTFAAQSLGLTLASPNCPTGFFGHAAIVAGDFDGDGILDLAAAGDSPLFLLPGSLPGGCGGGSVAYGPVSCFSTGNLFTSLVTGDFNGDGVPDIVAADAQAVVLMVGLGDGSFAAPAQILAGSHPALTIGDFDTDGTLDLALSNPAPTLSLLFGGAAAP